MPQAPNSTDLYACPVDPEVIAGFRRDFANSLDLRTDTAVNNFINAIDSNHDHKLDGNETAAMELARV